MSIDPLNYCFVVQHPDGRPVELEFREHDDSARQQYQGVWHKLALALRKHHELSRSLPVPEWTAWKPGEWCDQQLGYENRRKVVAWSGNTLVGFLNLWPDFQSNHDPAKRVLYIEHLAAAPGNISTELWQRRYGRVGPALFAYAVLVSWQSGFEGRLGLHVADESALGFYRHLNAHYCGSALFHAERTGIAGPSPRGVHEVAKTCLETTEAGAAKWLEGYRRA